METAAQTPELRAMATEGKGVAIEVQAEERRQLARKAEAEAEAVKEMSVMVAVDQSESSFYALQWALENLFRRKGAAVETEEVGMVTVVHVQQPFQNYVFPAGPGIYATSTVIESVRKAQEQNSSVILSRALRLCKDKMVKAETLILDGDPKEMICQAAEQMHVDLLLVGSRGLSKLKRAFLGSVSDYCAHHANCPILIVKPPKEKLSRESST
ncbi:Universal stress protein A-like protein [Vitis vinifera]|uniref:Universal stress protein A-like protein n=1 Tax=Vitis vinifera TaxID=29760 RepID=A0A438DSI6_VITVI|nr:Universal stress protein A-like protein [Vitis vinifera]